MTQRKRKWLFIISSTLFLTALGPLILYTLGYRFSFETLSLQKTGGLYITTRPIGARISIDGKFQKETSFLFRGFFMQNLTPKSYTVQVTSEKFLPWEKKLAVTPSTVTETRAVLVPRNPNETVLLRGPFTSFVGSPENAIFALTSSSSNTAGTTTTLSFYNRDARVMVTASDEKTRTLLSQIPKDATVSFFWRRAGTSLIVETPNDWLEISFSPGNTMRAQSLYRETALRKTFSKKPEYLIAHPADTTRYLILDHEKLYIWKGESTVLRPVLDTIAGVTMEQNGLMVLDGQSGLIYKTDLDGKSPQQLSDTKIPNIEHVSLVTHPKGDIIVSSNAGLWMLDPALKVPEALTRTSDNIGFETSETNIAWWENASLSILWLVQEEELPFYQTTFKSDIATLPQQISDVYFYPREHNVIVAAGETIYVIELDGRGGRNIFTLYKGKHPRIFVPQNDRVVYVLDDGILLEVALDVPFIPSS